MKKTVFLINFLLILIFLSSCNDKEILYGFNGNPERGTGQFRSTQNSILNDVMLQAFYWDVPVDEVNKNGSWWNTLKSQANELKSAGISGIWTPSPSKGNWGIIDNGYGIYDHYDLGNYDQRGTIETRFGSRLELEQMIAEMHKSQKIEVYADVVLNHIYSNDTNEEINPTVKTYVFNEAHGGQHKPFPANEIRWVIPNAAPGDYYIQIKGYGLPWTSSVAERGYDVMIRWDESNINESGQWEYEPNNGNGNYNVFPGSGKILKAHIENASDIDEYKITVSSTHNIEIRLAAKKEAGLPMQWIDAGSMLGYYPVAVWYKGNNIATSTLQAKTNTNISYVNHTGAGEPNYAWHYNNFHPSDENDWLGDYGSDEIITNTKFFGNDLNTFDVIVKNRLKDWGSWLINTIGYDGFRLDFVRGFQESFVAEWVKNLPLINGKQPFVVGEYWGADYRIKNWVNNVAALGGDVDGFDFPLKNTLTAMCNGNSHFDMNSLNHAGMVRNNYNALSGASVVTFLDNHDTGKEHDKWITKDFHLGYAYILTHEGKPCVFYPHFYSVTQHDAHGNTATVTAPQWLKDNIKKLIQIRKAYLGGTIVVLSETGNPYPVGNTKNIYIARRQGNQTKDGAIIVLNNNDTETKSIWVTVNASGFTNWSGQTLVNVLNTAQTITVQADGRAEFSAPARSYSIWVKASDLIQ